MTGNHLRRSSSQISASQLQELRAALGKGDSPSKKLSKKQVRKRPVLKRLTRKLSMGDEDFMGAPEEKKKGKDRKIFTLARSRWKTAKRLNKGAFLFGRTISDNMKRKRTRGKVILVSNQPNLRRDLSQRLDEFEVQADEEFDVVAAVKHIRKPFLDHLAMLCLFDPENEDDKTLSLFQEMDKHNVIFPVTIVVQDESYVNNPLVKRITSSFRNARLVALVPSTEVCCEEPERSAFDPKLCCNCKSPHVDTFLEFADFVERILDLGKREKTIRNHVKSSQQWDMQFKLKYQKRKEYNRTKTGKMAIRMFAKDWRRASQKAHFKAWAKFTNNSEETKQRRKTKRLTRTGFSTKNAAAVSKISKRQTEEAEERVKRMAEKRKIEAEKARLARVRNFSRDDPLLRGFITPSWIPKEMRERHLAEGKSIADMQRAASFFSRKIAMNDTISEWPLMCRALAYARSLKYSSSKEDIRLILSRLKTDHADYASVVYNRSVIHIKMGKLHLALEDLNTVIADENVEKQELAILKAALHNRVLLRRRHGQFVEANQDFYLLKYVAHRSSRKNSPVTSSRKQAPQKKLGPGGARAGGVSLQSLQGVLDESFVQGHNKHHGQQNTLVLLEKARDARNEDIYKKFKEDEKERLKTGEVEADEDQLYDDTHVLDELSGSSKNQKGDASNGNKKEENGILSVDLQAIAHRSLPADTDAALRVQPNYRTNEQVEACSYITSTLPCFGHYPQAVKDAMSRVMTLRDVKRDRVICRQGEDPDNYYIVIKGKLGVRIRDPRDPEATIIVNHMYPGTSFGELGLIFRQKRSATVYAEEFSSVLQVAGADFRAIGIANFHLKELQDKYKAYIRTGLFDEWTDENLTKLAAVTQKRYFQEGEKIINQGQISESFYILQTGVVKIEAYPNEAEEMRKKELVLQETLQKTKEKLRVHRDCDPEIIKKKYESQINEITGELEGLRQARKDYLEKYGDEDSKRSVETLVLTKPASFGENAILHPDKRELASVVALCYVECLAVTKSQVKASWVTKSFRRKMEHRSHRIPPGVDLRKLIEAEKYWEQVRSEVISEIEYVGSANNPLLEPEDSAFRKQWY